MTTITEPAFIAALAERGVTINRSQVNQFRPVAERRGDCRQYGSGRRSVWEWQASAVDVWAVYLQQRADMIAKGNWNSKRRYAVADVEWALQEQDMANDAAEARAPTYNGGCW